MRRIASSITLATSYGFLSDKLSVTGFRKMLMWLRVFFVRGHSPQLLPPPNWSVVLREPYSSIVLGSFLPTGGVPSAQSPYIVRQPHAVSEHFSGQLTRYGEEFWQGTILPGPSQVERKKTTKDQKQKKRVYF